MTEELRAEMQRLQAELEALRAKLGEPEPAEPQPESDAERRARLFGGSVGNPFKERENER
jgi:multidrug resistance efflux pump